MASRLTTEERCRQKRAYPRYHPRRDGEDDKGEKEVKTGKQGLWHRICSMKVKYRQLALAAVLLGAIAGFWNLLSVLGVKFLGFTFWE